MVGSRWARCGEWTHEGEGERPHGSVVFDGTSARYQGSIHDGVWSERANSVFANLGGTAGVYRLLSLTYRGKSFFVAAGCRTTIKILQRAAETAYFGGYDK